MANKQRGEVEITLKGKTYTLRPTFEGLAEMEDKSGKGLLGLAIAFGERGAGVKDLAAVVFGGLRGAGEKELSFEQVGQMIVESGVYTLSAPITEFLRIAIQGDSGAAEAETQGNDPAA